MNIAKGKTISETRLTGLRIHLVLCQSLIWSVHAQLQFGVCDGNAICSYLLNSGGSRISHRGAHLVGGSPTPEVATFRKICMLKTKEFGPLEVGDACRGCPLDPPMNNVTNFSRVESFFIVYCNNYKIGGFQNSFLAGKCS